MRLLEDMDRRLQNWSRYVWMMHSGGRVAGGGALEERVDGEGWDAPTVVPTDDNEAEETHAGVLALPGELRAPVEVWYLGAGGRRQKAARLYISETKLFESVAIAHRHLSTWLSEKALSARRQRERIEALQASARVTG